jgi:hypothetical protein
LQLLTLAPDIPALRSTVAFAIRPKILACLLLSLLTRIGVNAIFFYCRLFIFFIMLFLVLHAHLPLVIVKVLNKIMKLSEYIRSKLPEVAFFPCPILQNTRTTKPAEPVLLFLCFAGWGREAPTKSPVIL